MSIRKLLDDLREAGHDCRNIDTSLELDVESPIWVQVELACADSSQPIILEHYIAGMHGSNVEDEVERFLGDVESSEESMNKREVMVYLRMTRELFLLTTEKDDNSKTWDVLRRCAQMLAAIGEGVVQADDEGFFVKGQHILPSPKKDGK